MSGPEAPAPGDPLFRQEAIEEYLRGREHGALVRVSPLWKHWAFGALALTFAGAATFAALAPLGIDVRGQAVVRRAPGSGDALEVVCLLPAADAVHALRPGQPVAVALDGASSAPLRLVIGTPVPGIFGPARARAWLGPEVGDVPSLAAPVVLVVAPVPRAGAGAVGDLSPGMTGVAQVRVGQRTLLRSLLLEGAPR
jgi:hypothetical protein